MSDFEDYTQVFFEECDDLLGDLEDLLGALASGAAETETIHAAFRAVHSIKGGADAFGYRELVGFAHVYEAVMDAIRGDRLAVTSEVCDVLIRARDVLSDLVERARAAEEGELPAAALMSEELSLLVEETREDGAAAQAGPAPAKAVSCEPAGADGDPDAGQEPGSAAEEEVWREERVFTIRFAPGPDFHRSGHDALRVVQSLRDFGALDVVAEGELPPIEAFDPSVCPLGWRLELTTEASDEQVANFFDIYRGCAEIEIACDAPDAEDGAAPPRPGSVAADAPPEPKPAAQAASAEAKKSRPSPAKPSRTLRVDLDRVDRLVNMVGEIVIAQASLAQLIADGGESGLDAAHAIDTMSRQTRELQESVMAIRAQPVKPVFSRMSRLVRDLAQQLGKDARVEMLGEQTEVDTTVIEELAEPLIHMVRNSMDHGLESPDDRAAAGKPRQGVITISAEHRGERIVISIGDDGRGIDRNRVLSKAIDRGVVEPGATLAPEEIDQLIFHPGLSTAESVSSVSGRGVGMDVVKKNIHALGGRIALENRPGEGAKIDVMLPLSLAVLDGMTIVLGTERFVIPLGSVVEALTLHDAAPQRLPSGARVLRRRDEYLPLLSLRSVLGLAGEDGGDQMVVVVETDAHGHLGLLVDELIGQRQVVLKSLESNYRSVAGVSGATILSDGRAALILDIPALPGLASDRRIARPEYLQ